MRTRFKSFSLIPVALLALAMMLPAEAVSAQTAASHGDDLAASSLGARSSARRHRSRSRDRAGGDIDSGGNRVRMARASRRRGRLHHRWPGRDDGTGRANVVLHAGDGFLIPPRTPHNARDLGPETGGCCRLISSRQTSRSRRSWTHPFRVGADASREPLHARAPSQISRREP